MTPWPQRYKEQRFGALLVILVVLLAGPPIVMGFGVAAVWFDGLMSVLMLAAIISLCLERKQRFFALLLGVPSIVLSLGAHAVPASASKWVSIVGHGSEVLFLLGSAMVIVTSLFSTRRLSLDSVLGAICGYLFVGLGWAVIYSMIEHLQPGSFQLSPSLALAQPGDARSPSDVLIYYSFVTLTTVGYGDVVPNTPTTRTFAWMEAICGQFYLAVIVAGLVSVLVSRSSARED